MCETNAYLYRDGKEELVLQDVNTVEPVEEGGYRLVNIFGDQKTVLGRIRRMSLVDHRIVFEE
ncbi:MAG: CooT family nickel-binding protein [bacterium]